jgi:nitric oxide reductase activation protein
VGQDVARLNLFQMVEYARVLARIRQQWPGARRLVAFGLATESKAQPPQTRSERLFFELARNGDGADAAGPQRDAGGTAVGRDLAGIVSDAVNVFDTAALLTPELVTRALAAYPDLRRPLRTFAFLPDFLYPGQVSRPPQDALVADMKAEARRRRDERAREEDDRRRQAPGGDERPAREETGERAGGVAAAYVYDEWSQDENDYYLNYCHVHEMPAKPAGARDLPAEILDLARRTRRAFEMLRPELSKEKYLSEGDAINVDLLTSYLVQRRREPSPCVNFYEKPFHNRRDLATLILLDVSGSTGSEVERQTTIELEKQAALILGQGLSALGDRFAVGGFSGNGREHCEFFIFKDFDAAWDRRAIARVLAAHPRSATRIGAALRHAGYRLAQVPARQRLILLITDGKPMDAGYDPATRYAQYDVRMACQENLHREIHTFCISTDDNSRADMEIMFPARRYAILPDIRVLPRVLPRLYVKLTV